MATEDGPPPLSLAAWLLLFTAMVSVVQIAVVLFVFIYRPVVASCWAVMEMGQRRRWSTVGGALRCWGHRTANAGASNTVPDEFVPGHKRTIPDELLGAAASPTPNPILSNQEAECCVNPGTPAPSATGDATTPGGMLIHPPSVAISDNSTSKPPRRKQRGSRQRKRDKAREAREAALSTSPAAVETSAAAASCSTSSTSASGVRQSAVKQHVEGAAQGQVTAQGSAGEVPCCPSTPELRKPAPRASWDSTWGSKEGDASRRVSSRSDGSRILQATGRMPWEDEWRRHVLSGDTMDSDPAGVGELDINPRPPSPCAMYAKVDTFLMTPTADVITPPSMVPTTRSVTGGLVTGGPLPRRAGAAQHAAANHLSCVRPTGSVPRADVATTSYVQAISADLAQNGADDVWRLIHNLKRQLADSRRRRHDETVDAAKARAKTERALKDELRYLKAQRQVYETQRRKEVSALLATIENMQQDNKALQQQVAQLQGANQHLQAVNQQQAAAAEASVAHMQRAWDQQALHSRQLRAEIVQWEAGCKAAAGDIVRGKQQAAQLQADMAAAVNNTLLSQQAFAALVQQVNVIAARGKGGVPVKFAAEVLGGEVSIAGTGANGAVVRGLVTLELPPADPSSSGEPRQVIRRAVAKRLHLDKVQELPMCLASGWRRGVPCYGLLLVDLWEGGPQWAIIMADGGSNLHEVVTCDAYANVAPQLKARLAADYVTAVLLQHRLGHHGDLKPANAVVGSLADVLRGHPHVQLIDMDTAKTPLGLAQRQRSQDPDGFIRESKFAGTSGYAAAPIALNQGEELVVAIADGKFPGLPEQILEQAIDTPKPLSLERALQCDIYSVCAVVWELLVGRLISGVDGYLVRAVGATQEETDHLKFWISFGNPWAAGQQLLTQLLEAVAGPQLGDHEAAMDVGILVIRGLRSQGQNVTLKQLRAALERLARTAQGQEGQEELLERDLLEPEVEEP